MSFVKSKVCNHGERLHTSTFAYEIKHIIDDWIVEHISLDKFTFLFVSARFLHKIFHVERHEEFTQAGKPVGVRNPKTGAYWLIKAVKSSMVHGAFERFPKGNGEIFTSLISPIASWRKIWSCDRASPCRTVTKQKGKEILNIYRYSLLMVFTELSRIWHLLEALKCDIVRDRRKRNGKVRFLSLKTENILKDKVICLRSTYFRLKKSPRQFCCYVYISHFCLNAGLLMISPGKNKNNETSSVVYEGVKWHDMENNSKNCLHCKYFRRCATSVE